MQLKEARHHQGLSQGALADELHVTRQTISKWETGRGLPDLENLIRLSDLCGVAIDDLVRKPVSE